jgi:hypothetical protein
LDQPFYAEAQQDIDRWSQLIFDLALGRAEQRDYEGAIVAAQLFPKDRANSKEVEKWIANWQTLSQQQQTNRASLDQAQALIRRNSASSYSKAINIAKQIPEGQPQFFEAQRLIGTWSSKILEIAETRAGQGQYQGAIQAAALIPPEMPHYQVAQTRIRTWQGE